MGTFFERDTEELLFDSIRVPPHSYVEAASASGQCWWLLNSLVSESFHPGMDLANCRHKVGTCP